MITPNSPTRLTLRDAAGVPLLRWTLQVSDRQGRKLAYPPEVVTTKGAAPNHALAHVFRGFRPELDITWAYSLASLLEVYDGSAWLPGSSRATAAGLMSVLAACENAVYVEPYAGAAAFDFMGRCYAEAQTVKDVKGVLHSGLALKISAEGLIDQIPAGAGSTVAWPGGNLSAVPSGGSVPAWVSGPVYSGGSSGGATRKTVTIHANASSYGPITPAPGATLLLLSAVSTVAGRLRVYTSDAARITDSARAVGTSAAAGKGLMGEVVFTDGLLNQPYTPLGSGSVATGDAFTYRWDGSSATLTLTFLVLEV